MSSTPCPYCGSAPVSHAMERFSIIFSHVMGPYDRAMEALWRLISPLFRVLHTEKLALPLMEFFSFFGRGITTLQEHLQPSDSMRTQVMWDEANNRGIKVVQFCVFHRPINIFCAQFNGETIIFEGLPMPRGKEPLSLSWMDNKGEMRKRFIRAGIPVAKGGTCLTRNHALHVFRNIASAVIVKPVVGSRSRHTFTHITTEAELLRAVKIAKQLSPWVVVEEELKGTVHRATMIGGKVVGVLRRDPPFVMGDGVHTVRQLWEEENKNPKRQGPIFHHLPDGPETEEELKRQGLTWQNVPSRGWQVTFHQKVGRGEGGSNADVTDITHPENIKLFEKIATVLDTPLVGVDFIIKDISKPWTDQPKTGVIECNSLPFIDLHSFPLTGTARNLGAPLWDIVFPESKHS